MINIERVFQTRMGQWLVVVALLLLVPLVVSDLEGQQQGQKLKYFTSHQPVYGMSEWMSQKNMSFTMTLLRRDQHEELYNTGPPKTYDQSFHELLQRNRERVAYYTKVLGRATHGDVSTKAVFESSVMASNGEYMMTLMLGTPPQSLSVIVDTGSDLNWVQCSTCTACFGRGGVNFDPTKSSTYHPAACNNKFCMDIQTHSCVVNVCQYQTIYADDSQSIGDLVHESITFNNGQGGTTSLPNIVVGCGKENSGSFAGTRGIVGLGQGPLSLLTQLSTNSIPKVFAYCLSSRMDATGKSTLTIGALPKEANVVYTPMVANPAFTMSFYYVQLNGIEVGGKALAIEANVFALNPKTGEGGVILDSGSTITTLNKPAYDAIIKAYHGIGSLIDGTQYGLDLCWVTDPVLPVMVLKFQGANMVLQAENLLVRPAKGVVCLAISFGFGFSVIGNIAQANHLMVHDIPARRIGIAAKVCAP